MLADYCYLAYRHLKNHPTYESALIYHAKTILQYFNDYPGSSSMRAEIDAYEKKEEERRRKALIRKSVSGIPKYSRDGNYKALSRMIDSLVSDGDPTIIGEAFIDQQTTLMSLAENGGYYQEYAKLSKWLGYDYIKKHESTYGIDTYMRSLYVSSQKNQRPSVYLSIDKGTYASPAPIGQVRASYEAIIDPTEAKLSKAIKEMKGTFKKRGSYNIKINRIAVGWAQLAICFMTENYDLITRNKSLSYYHGIWARIIDHTSAMEVVKVDKNSPGERNGISQGDLILKVNGKTIKGLKSENTYRLLSGDYRENRSRISLEVKKGDGRVLKVEFPIRVNKENIRNKFKGTESLLRTEEPIANNSDISSNAASNKNLINKPKSVSNSNLDLVSEVQELHPEVFERFKLSIPASN